MNPRDFWTRVLASRFVFWPMCLAGLALIGLAVVGPEARRRLNVDQQCAAMQAEVDSLTFTRDQLLAKQSALQNNPAFIEQVVRDELGITRPGEEWMPLPPKAAPKEAPKEAEPAPPAARSAADPVLAYVVRYYDPARRFECLAIGTALLIVAIVLSLPGRQARPAKA